MQNRRPLIHSLCTHCMGEEDGVGSPDPIRFSFLGDVNGQCRPIHGGEIGMIWSQKAYILNVTPYIKK